jgi:hypothetical protein
MNSLKILESALGEFFCDNFYQDGIKNLKNAIDENPYYRNNWHEVIKLVLNKELSNGVPLNLIHFHANLPLDDNTDEGAYQWLNIMIINSINRFNYIIEYPTGRKREL